MACKTCKNCTNCTSPVLFSVILARPIRVIAFGSAQMARRPSARRRDAPATRKQRRANITCGYSNRNKAERRLPYDARTTTARVRLPREQLDAPTDV